MRTALQWEVHSTRLISSQVRQPTRVFLPNCMSVGSAVFFLQRTIDSPCSLLWSCTRFPKIGRFPWVHLGHHHDIIAAAFNQQPSKLLYITSVAMAKLTVYHYYPLPVMGLYMFPPNCPVPLGGSGTSASHHHHCIQLTTIKAAVHNVSGNGQAHCYHYYVLS